jgi:hypothetical protein
MYQDYQTGKTGYSTGQGSYSTNRQSYNGTWDRSVSPDSDLFPQKQPVGIFGSPPRDPYYYNNYYWGMPWWSRMFYQPNYYYSPWGYHFFAPRLLTWFLLLGLLASSFFAGIVDSAVKASGFNHHAPLASLTRWSIMIFTVIAALSQLQIATAFLQDLFRAIVAMLAIAGGIAFGLGGKDSAKQALENIKEDLTSK